jgi:hypothetical protein
MRTYVSSHNSADFLITGCGVRLHRSGRITYRLRQAYATSEFKHTAPDPMAFQVYSQRQSYASTVPLCCNTST